RRGRGAHADGLDLAEPRHGLHRRRVPRGRRGRDRPDPGGGDRRLPARRGAELDRVLHDRVDRQGAGVRADRRVPAGPAAGDLHRAHEEPRMRRRWAVPAAFAVAAVLLFVVAPLALSPFRLDQLGRYLCFAIVGVGIGLAWGRGGMLTLGQGVFFGMGAYLMAMHLKLADAGPGGTPDFMTLISSDGVPWWWEPFRSEVVTLLAILLLPAAVATVLGLATFRRKVRGAYFAILSQALAAAFAILLIGNPTGTGGSTGLSGFRGFFGFALSDPANRLVLFCTAAGVLLLVLALARQLMVSRYGELLVACRDAEERVRFLGYDPANVKTVAFATAAFMAGIAGALSVPIVGIVSP